MLTEFWDDVVWSDETMIRSNLKNKDKFAKVLQFLFKFKCPISHYIKDQFYLALTLQILFKVNCTKYNNAVQVSIEVVSSSYYLSYYQYE